MLLASAEKPQCVLTLGHNLKLNKLGPAALLKAIKITEKVNEKVEELEAKKIEYTIKVNTFQGGFDRALMLFSGEEFDTCSSSKAGEVITCRQELDALEMELYPFPCERMVRTSN